MSKKRFLALLGGMLALGSTSAQPSAKTDTSNPIPFSMNDTSTSRSKKTRKGTKRNPISKKKRKSKQRLVKASRRANRK